MVTKSATSAIWAFSSARKCAQRANKLGGGNIPLRPAEVRIRATVIGASQYTVQVSGNTIYLSHPEIAAAAESPSYHAAIRANEAITADEIKAAVEQSIAALRR